MRPNRHPLDEDSAARMLGGHVHPDDAPPGYGPVAALLASASALPEVDEDVAGVTISAMVEAIRESESVPQTQRRKSMLTKLLAGKALAATIGVIALTASGAAAATGSLPDPAQGAVAGAASHVGVHIPQPGDRGHSAGHRQDGAHRPTDDSTTSTTAGTDDTAGQDNHGATVSGTAHQAKEDGQPVGPTVCAVASAGKCRAGTDHSGKGDDDSTTSSTAGSASDHSQAGEHSEADDHSQGGDDGSEAGEDHGGPSTTVTTGSLATGEDHSGKGALPDDGNSSSGRH